MTLAGFFWFLVAVAGAFLLGYMCGRYDAHKIVLGADDDAADSRVAERH